MRVGSYQVCSLDMGRGKTGHQGIAGLCRGQEMGTPESEIEALWDLGLQRIISVSVVTEILSVVGGSCHGQEETWTVRDVVKRVIYLPNSEDLSLIEELMKSGEGSKDSKNACVRTFSS